MGVGGVAMGRKRGRPKADSSPPPDSEGRVTIVHLKGSPEFARWLDVAHRKTSISKAQIFRLGLSMWAAANALPEPPEI